MEEPEPPQDDDIPSFDLIVRDPEIAALLDFEPCERSVQRKNGWKPELQREFIARLGFTGSAYEAVNQMGKNISGIEAIYRDRRAASFRDAWDRALELGQKRAAEREGGSPFMGRAPGIRVRGQKGEAAPAEPPSDDNDGLPDGDEEEQEEAKLLLMERIAVKFMRKVAAEREARLAGKIVAADFYLRQVTFLEVMFDLTGSKLGWNPADLLRSLRRGKASVMEIASTPLTDWLDEARREWWASEGEPERPPHPDGRFLQQHGRGDQAYTTNIDQHAYGACTTPARGFDEEQWAAMNYEQQRAARAAQFAEDARAQIEWEARAREAWRASRAQR